MQGNWLVGVFGAAWILMIPVTVSYLVIASRIFSRLERDHSSEYERLGRPSLFLNNTIPNGLRFMRFLLMREFSELQDAKLHLLATVARWELISVMVLTFVSLLLVVAVPITRHVH